jgi:hypothetical protein
MVIEFIQPALTPTEVLRFLFGSTKQVGSGFFVPRGQRLAMIEGLCTNLTAMIHPHERGRLGALLF